MQLDGSGSSDPEDNSLAYSWTLAAPDGSTATLSDATIVNPTFVADVDGEYLATLVVNDGASDSVSIRVRPERFVEFHGMAGRDDDAG